jgi:hypothetical protein
MAAVPAALLAAGQYKQASNHTQQQYSNNDFERAVAFLNEEGRPTKEVYMRKQPTV